MSAPDHFELLQDRLIARLSNYKDNPADPKPFLQDTHNSKTIPVFDERIGDVDQKLRTALASGLGIAVVILTPVMKLTDPKKPALAGLALVKIQVQENVTFNQGNSGTKVSAMKVRNMIMRATHHWPHLLYAGSADTQRILLEQIPYVLVSEDPVTIYDVDATAPINLSAPLAT